jgi:hypothetical protein
VSGAAYQYAPATYQVELRAPGQSDADFQRQLVVRKFALVYVDAIARDLAAGSGDHLEALVGLANENGDEVTTEDIASAMVASRGESRTRCRHTSFMPAPTPPVPRRRSGTSFSSCRSLPGSPCPSGP